MLLVGARSVFELEASAGFVEHDAQDAIDGVVIGAVSIPDGDLVGVEAADGDRDSAQIIACKWRILAYI